MLINSGCQSAVKLISLKTSIFIHHRSVQRIQYCLMKFSFQVQRTINFFYIYANIFITALYTADHYGSDNACQNFFLLFCFCFFVFKIK